MIAAGACERFTAEPATRIGEDVLKDIRSEGAARWAAAWAARDVVARRPDAPGLFLALAPMDGITDAVYRALLTALFGGRSGISVCVSEFVRVTRDQVEDYARRKGMSISEVERWLAPNLGYESA